MHIKKFISVLISISCYIHRLWHFLPWSVFEKLFPGSAVAISPFSHDISGLLRYHRLAVTLYLYGGHDTSCLSRVYQRISNHSFPPFIHITWHILFVNICLLGHILRKAFSDILCLRSISIPLVQVPERVWKIFPTNVSYRFISTRYMLPACHAHTHRYVMGVLRQMKHVCKKDTLLSKGTLSPEKDTSW